MTKNILTKTPSYITLPLGTKLTYVSGYATKLNKYNKKLRFTPNINTTIDYQKEFNNDFTELLADPFNYMALKNDGSVYKDRNVVDTNGVVEYRRIREIERKQELRKTNSTEFKRSLPKIFSRPLKETDEAFVIADIDHKQLKDLFTKDIDTTDKLINLWKDLSLLDGSFVVLKSISNNIKLIFPVAYNKDVKDFGNTKETSLKFLKSIQQRVLNPLFQTTNPKIDTTLETRIDTKDSCFELTYVCYEMIQTLQKELPKTKVNYIDYLLADKGKLVETVQKIENKVTQIEQSNVISITSKRKFVTEHKYLGLNQDLPVIDNYVELSNFINKSDARKNLVKFIGFVFQTSNTFDIVQEKLGEYLNCSQKHASRLLKEACDLGLIVVSNEKYIKGIKAKSYKKGTRFYQLFQRIADLLQTNKTKSLPTIINDGEWYKTVYLIGCKLIFSSRDIKKFIEYIESIENYHEKEDRKLHVKNTIKSVCAWKNIELLDNEKAA